MPFFLPENVQKHERLVENRLLTGIYSSLYGQSRTALGFHQGLRQL